MKVIHDTDGTYVRRRPARSDAHAKPQMTKATKHASRMVAPTTMTHSRGLI
jgi:hypothetical protein